MLFEKVVGIGANIPRMVGRNAIIYGSKSTSLRRIVEVEISAVESSDATRYSR